MRRPTKEHYKILQVSENADLDEVKKAYRKRAFELHPDLNPQNPNANTDFQLLNEAYVVLTSHHSQENISKAKANAQYQTHQKQGEETKGKPGGSNHRKDQANNTQNQSSSQQQEAKQEQKEEAKQERQKSETHRRTYAKNPFHATKKASSAYTNESNKAQSKVHAKQEEPYSAPSQEDVLHEILNDPFARRVYEDIYSSLNNKPSPKNNKNENEKFVKIDWSRLKPNIDLSSGVGGFMKTWLRKQIDDELEYHLPVANLYPGSKVRLQIGQGFSNETRTVDITLPKDFVIGKPVRLVGLGKKIGKVQGDLYLTLLPSLGNNK